MDPEQSSTPTRLRRRDARQGAPPTPEPLRISSPSRPTWRSVPQLAAGLVALIGVALVVSGGLAATVLKPPAVTSATLLAPTQAVVSTAVGVLGLEGPRVQIEARAGSSTPVFLGIGRAADVDAYLAQAARLEVVGYDGNRSLVTERLGSAATLPDPAGVDVWVVSNRGLGAARLSWPDAPGQWRLVAATDGAAVAPASLTLTWSGRTQHSSAPALISIGLVLLVAGALTLAILVARSRLDPEDSS